MSDSFDFDHLPQVPFNPENLRIAHPAWCDRMSCRSDTLTGEGLHYHVRSYGPLEGVVSREGYADAQPRLTMPTPEQLTAFDTADMLPLAYTLAGALEDTDRTCAILGEEVEDLRAFLTGDPHGEVPEAALADEAGDVWDEEGTGYPGPGEALADADTISTVIGADGITVGPFEGLDADEARRLARLLLHSARSLETMLGEGE